MDVRLLPQHWRTASAKWKRSAYFAASLLLATLTLASLVYAAVLLWEEPYTGLRWDSRSGLIYAVDAGSPAAQAGIRPEDTILLVNGVPFSRVRSWLRTREGKMEVTLTLERAGQFMTIPLRFAPAPLGLRVQRLVPLLVALVFWGISLGVWAFHHGHRVTRLFFLASQVTAALLATGSISTVYTQYVPWSRMAFSLLLPTVAPLTLHFFTRFPQEVPRGLRQRMVFPAYGIALLLTVVTLLSYGGYISPEWPHQPLNRVYVATVFILALFVVLRRWEDATLQVLRSRRLLAMGMGISITPLLFLSLIPDTLLKAPLVDYTWTFLFLTAIPVIYAWALRAGELGTVDWVLSRTLAHLVLSGVFLLIYLLLFLWVDDLVPLASQTSPLIMAGLAVTAAALFAPTRRYLLHLADRFLYGGWYDYRTTLQALSQKLRGVIRTEDLADLLVDQLSEALRLRGAVLLLVDDGHLVPTRAIGVFARPLPPPLPARGNVGKWLMRANKPITPAQMRRALAASELTPAEAAWIHLSDAALWLPLVHGGDVKGLLLLGTRISGDPLEPEDLLLLDILAAHAATATENIRLVENLWARVEEVKQLYAQLAKAREAERKHLARELHDVVLQDLINAYVTLDQIMTVPDSNTEEQRQW
ncbi:MAG TPA: PDZ domain-containing protein, partial [Anaerolineae bacterium]|nr:PDZ domain-containing protein [Anaerolineae bacterium]